MLALPLEVARVHDVTVVRILEQRLLWESEVQQLTSALLRLAKEPGTTRMLLDFGAVKSLTSAVLANLLGLRKCLCERGGRLALCGLSKEVREVFALAGLQDVLNVYATEQEALRSFPRAAGRSLTSATA
jgi:anti-sigma B factor antagonist